MAAELQTLATTARTVYFLIRNSTGSIWNGTSFETYATANFATYDVLATEQGTASGFYTATFPAAIVAGTYSIVAKVQSGGSPAEGDQTTAEGTFEWNGTAPAPLSDTATSGQVGQFAPIRLARGVALSGFAIYLKSAADHVTPLTSGTISGQIAKDGGSFGPFQSGTFTEMGQGFYKINLTSGDLLCTTAAMLFTGVNISGAATADPLPISLVLQRTSGAN